MKADAHVIPAPVQVLYLILMAGKRDRGSLRWNFGQVRFGRDAESAYAAATESHILGIARWNFDPSKPPVPEFGVARPVVRSAVRGLLGMCWGRETPQVSAWSSGGESGIAASPIAGTRLDLTDKAPDGRFPPVAMYDAVLRAEHAGDVEPEKATHLCPRLLLRACRFLRLASPGSGTGMAGVRHRLVRLRDEKGENMTATVAAWKAEPHSGGEWPMGLRLWAMQMPLSE